MLLKIYLVENIKILPFSLTSSFFFLYFDIISEYDQEVYDDIAGQGMNKI